MKPAVLYAAKSTEDKHGSIPDQIADGRRLAADLGFEIVRECEDEAKSAFHGDRGPGLAQAMVECERLSAEYGSCALIVQRSDRLARGDAKKARSLVEIVLWAIKHEVALHSVMDPEILAGGDFALVMGVIGAMKGHGESKAKSESVRKGIRRRAVERRQFVGGRRPYGYRHRDRTDDGRGTGPLVARAPIDAAVWTMFEKEVLDLDATRALVVGQVERADGVDAEGELARAEAAVERTEGDYIAGRITLEQWSRVEQRVTEELAAAQAEAEQHRRKREAAEAAIAEFDADVEIVKQLAALRAQVAGEVRERGADLPQLRALLRRLFAGFELAPHGDGYLLLPSMLVDRLPDGRWDFEGSGRAPLDFSDNLYARFATW